ncbi:plasminogen-like [Tubulanus polymorphus]|uniref:plasminogen-like n=1 Tax=Tubulanus polymorphus TaxID=672921 RepID=UPI003DA65491
MLDLSCLDGYQLYTGKLNRQCQNDGKFEGQKPECYKITVNTCLAPVIGTGMLLVDPKTSYQTGNTAIVACSAGHYSHDVQAQRSLVCFGNQNLWQSSVPSCYDHPTAVRNCLISNKGVEYLGNRAVTDSGEKCIAWSSFSHAYSSSEHWSNLDGSIEAASNYCRNPGTNPAERPWCYTKIGGNPVFCNIPRCKMSCGPPEEVNGATITNRKNVYVEGDIVEYQCSSIANKVVMSTCLSTGVYSTNNLNCEDVCPKPPTIENAQTDAKGVVKAGESIQYQCDDTFYLVAGNTQVSCSTEAKWVTNNLPVCKDASQAVNYCKLRVSGTGYRGNMSETFGIRCQEWSSTFPHSHHFTYVEGNYCRNPSNSKTPWCYTTREQIRWLYCNLPICQSSCGDPEGGVGVTRIDANPLIFHDGKERAVVTYKCSSSDTVLLSGDLQRICQADRAFSGSPPVCGLAEEQNTVSHADTENDALPSQEEPTCTRPGDGVNARKTGDPWEYTAGAVVEYQCLPGYILVSGSLEITCTSAGTYDAFPPTCEARRVQRARCGRPPWPRRSTRLVTTQMEYFDGDTAVYECRHWDDIIIRGNTRRTCRHDGRFTGRDLSCMRRWYTY